MIVSFFQSGFRKVNLSSFFAFIAGKGNRSWLFASAGPQCVFVRFSSFPLSFSRFDFLEFIRSIFIPPLGKFAGFEA